MESVRMAVKSREEKNDNKRTIEKDQAEQGVPRGLVKKRKDWNSNLEKNQEDIKSISRLFNLLLQVVARSLACDRTWK